MRPRAHTLDAVAPVGALRAPLGTVTTRDRFALVRIEGAELPIVGIGKRMLTWRELAAAQGFPPDYVLDRGADGRPMSRATIVRLIGNSVSPPRRRSAPSSASPPPRPRRRRPSPPPPDPNSHGVPA